MVTNTASITVGRLLEVRANAGYRTASDVDQLFDAIDREVAKLPQTQMIITVADWRHCPVIASAAVDRVLQRIVALNHRTERSVALARTDSATAVMQFVRLIREANLPDRKMFFSPEELIDWLNEVLSPSEKARLQEFLRENEKRPAVASGGR